MRRRPGGGGIKKEAVSRIFDKFYQEDESHASAGNGLGLALVKRIAELSDAAVTVQSTPGAGSVFAVTADPSQILLCIILAVPAFAGWILPYFVYKKVKAEKIKKLRRILKKNTMKFMKSAKKDMRCYRKIYESIQRITYIYRKIPFFEIVQKRDF